MPISLPTTHVRGWTPRLVPEASRSASASGGNVQQFVPAQRWAFDVDLTTMNQADAMAWTDLTDQSDTLVWTIPQGDLVASNEGTPLVDGAGQLGSTLNLDGLTVGFVVPRGAFVSIITSSRRYVYQVKAAATASGVGEVALSIRPPLRVSPDNNDTVEIATPKVEGIVLASSGRFGAQYRVGPRSFTIEERG